MNYFRFTLEKINQNPHLIFFYIIISMFLIYLLDYVFGIKLYDITKEDYLKYIFSYKYYITLIISITLHSFFTGGLWYSISIDKELSFKEYLNKSFYFFKRFMAFGLIGFVIIMTMSISLFIDNKILASFLFFVSLISIYFGIKIILAPAYIVYLDCKLLDAFKRSYFSVRGVYFWFVALASIARNFLAKNQILNAFFDVLMICFLCFIFVKIKSPENVDKKIQEF